MFLDQDYQGEHIMLIFDSGPQQELCLPTLPANKQIIYKNVQDFTSVGEKYNKAIDHWITFNPDIVTSWDDDDLFLPNHISEGFKGMMRAYEQNMYAYKPQKSYYRDKNGIFLVENTLEPSIFVDAEWLKAMGYANVNVKYHQQWLDPLTGRNKILVDPEGIPTLIYNWGSEVPVFKMSGTRDAGVASFLAHQMFSRDFGDGIITPVHSMQEYYDEIKNLKKS